MLLITEFIPAEFKKFQQIDTQFVDFKIIYPFIRDQFSQQFFYILCADAKSTVKKIFKSVSLIEAAGGLVVNERNEYLAIFRNGKWDLPKGKLEANEKMREAAVREVEEECGIKVSQSGKKICKTYHVYTIKNEVVLKKTHWYKMKAEGQDKLKPQKEEGITKVRWFTKERLNTICKNTYPSIIEVLQKRGLLKDKEVLLSE